jgi:hypothetical protein
LFVQTNLDTLPTARYVPKPPGYHERLTSVPSAPLICTAYMATLCPLRTDDLRLLDATLVPYGTGRPTVRRFELPG